MLVTRFLAGFFIVLIVAFSGCVSSQEAPYSNAADGEMAGEFGQIALEACSKINDSDLKGYCFAMAKRDESYCAKLQDAAKRDLCYGRLITSLEKAEFCDKMQSTQNKDICYAQIGSLKGNPEFCDKITDNSRGYKDICYASVANLTHQADICHKASFNDTIDSCYLFLADAWKDSTLCDKISGGVRKYECLVKTDSCLKLSNSSQIEACWAYNEAETFSLEKCENLSITGGASAGDSCYWNEATQKKDSRFCAKINIAGERMLCVAVTKNEASLCCDSRGECSDYCYRGFASYNNDSSICSYINDSADKVWCLAVTNKNAGICDIYQNIGLVDKDVPWNSSLALDEFCTGNKSSGYSKLCYCRLKGKNTAECYTKVWWLTNDCYQRVAVSKKDPRICDNLVEWIMPSENGTEVYNSTNAFNCRSSVVASAEDISTCSRPEFKGVLEPCTYWIALSKNQSVLCSQLSGEKDRDNCFAIVSSKTSDASLCSSILDVDARDNCLTTIAAKLKNPEYCLKIDSVGSRDLCYIFLVENLI